jgi:putative ABC transport system substrate-binding protein
VRRRQFISLLGGAAAWPVAARGERASVPVIGLLRIGTPSSRDLTGFRLGLREEGFIEGQNLAIEYRWANNDPDRLPRLAADLVRLQVHVIAIPIVFGFGSDPVQQGVVASLNRPGGNITGMTSQSAAVFGKQFGILHELVPHAAHFGVLSNPKSAIHNSIIEDTQTAASALGRTIEVLTASTSGEIDAVFERLANEKRVQGLLVSNDPLFGAARVQLAILAARFAVPAIYPFRAQAEAGGLLSYGPDLVDRDREVGHYVGRILKGERPADLPVQQSSKFEFIINMRTAKALGLEVSPQLLARADDVIE